MPADIDLYTLTCSHANPPRSSALVSFLIVVIVVVYLVFICDSLVLFFYKNPLAAFLSQEIFTSASTACRHRTLVVRNGREYLEFGLEVFA